jgi:hypothetical protein
MSQNICSVPMFGSHLVSKELSGLAGGVSIEAIDREKGRPVEDGTDEPLGTF